jgi:hypothetical protein
MTTHILTERLISPDERRDAIVVEAGLEAHEGAKTCWSKRRARFVA